MARTPNGIPANQTMKHLGQIRGVESAISTLMLRGNGTRSQRSPPNSLVILNSYVITVMNVFAQSATYISFSLRVSALPNMALNRSAVTMRFYFSAFRAAPG
jgi:hypothetical protein